MPAQMMQGQGMMMQGQPDIRSQLVMPSIPGLPPQGFSPLFHQGVQMPRQLLGEDGSGTNIEAKDVCSLYVQVLEANEEITRLNEANELLTDEMDIFQKKFDTVIAKEEVLYSDFFKQKTFWEEEKEKLEQAKTKKEEDIRSLQLQVRNLEDQFRTATGGKNTDEDVNKTLKLMQRVAILEDNETKITRKYVALEQDFKTTKHAYDVMELQFGENEAYLKQKLNKVILWKQQAENVGYCCV